MSTSDVIAGIGLVVSALSFLLSIKSYSVSQKSLSITKQQNDERSLGISLYYMDAYKWKKDKEVYVSFALRFTNNSTQADAISKIELHIEYRDNNNVVGKIKLNPDTLVTPVNLKTYSEILRPPLNLPEKNAKLGWITFKLPSFLKENLLIDLYEIVAEAIDNKKISIDTHIVNEV